MNAAHAAPCSVGCCGPDRSPSPSPRVVDPAATDTERNWAVAMHLSPLAAIVFGPAILAPLVLWLVRKDESGFDDDHGREVVNMLLTGLILTFVLILIPIIGWLALATWYVCAAVGMVRGAIASGRGEFFRYPMVIRMIT
ncbi:MAG: DUF4870 domain-containing protein [Planctomycetota bacterium]|jgi:uncharacterized Tic20 family protein